MIILNKYKDTLNDLIDSPNPKSLDWIGLIDERFYNALRSESSLAGLSKKDYLDKNILD